jgi:hypothetical protein
VVNEADVIEATVLNCVSLEVAKIHRKDPETHTYIAPSLLKTLRHLCPVPK